MYIDEIALRYAFALANYGAQNDLLDTFEQELNEVEATLDQTEGMATYLSHPKIRPSDKQELLAQVFSSFSPEMLNFLCLLVEKKRWQHLKEIRRLFIREANLYRGKVAVEVETAYPLEDNLERQLQAKLEKVTKRPIELTTKTTPELIGGLKVRIGHQVIDGSIANQLRELKREVMEQTGKK